MSKRQRKTMQPESRIHTLQSGGGTVQLPSGNDIFAATCSRADVGAAVALAVDGDSVHIPAGTCSWTTNLTVTVAITLQGAGADVTILQDDVPKGDASCAGANPMLTISVTGNKRWRLTGFTVQGSATDPFICQAGHVVISGGSHQFRIDHLAFTNQQTAAIRTFGDLWGVIDHCTFTGTHKNGIIIFHDTWGGVGGNGDNSWAQPDSMGTEQALFIEDCTFNDTSAQGAGAFDSFQGGRLVFRHNTCAFVGTHGTESGQRARSIRQYEIYNNTFTCQPGGMDTASLVRGGTGAVFNNTFNKGSNPATDVYTNMMKLVNDRDADCFPPWGTAGACGAADGTSPFDSNDGVTYDSGTHNGASGGSNVLTDTTKAWAVNQWTPDFSIRNTTAGWGSNVVANTATTLTNVGSNFGQSRVWNAGDAYQIKKCYPAIDEIGRGGGDLLSGNPPTPAAWPNQPLSPLYQWNNTFQGTSNPLLSVGGGSQGHIKASRDYYDNVTKPGYTSFTYPHPLVT